MNFKSLEDKCRYYQSLTDYRIMPNSYVICHLDGRGFSSCIKNTMKKPFDEDFARMMDECTKALCAQVQGCKFAYTQSDEISLLLTDIDVENEGKSGDVFFDGRLCKINSICASICTATFNRLMAKYLVSLESTVDRQIILELLDNMTYYNFDCKCWVVPNVNDAFAWFLYRHIDCVRNSKQQFAQTYCSYEELVRKNTDEQIQVCKEKTGYDWNIINDRFKYGRYISRYQKKYFNKELNAEYIRHTWEAVPGFPLTEERDRFLNEYHIFKSNN